MTFIAQLFARREFALPAFELQPLRFDTAADPDDELLLDQAIKDRPVVQARLAGPLPTAGELRESIELHLRSARAGNRRADAADELCEALAELRQSLG